MLSGEKGDEVNLVAFQDALVELSVDDIRAVGASLRDRDSADDVAWWGVTLVTERLLGETRGWRRAAFAARGGAEAVRVAGRRGGLDANDPDVVAVARAAARVCRVLVAAEARPGAIERLGGGWAHLLRCPPEDRRWRLALVA